MPDISFFLVAGFLAQLIDGALGMGYGVFCASLLLSMGIAPGAASASVHTAKLFTTASSGFCHWKLGNIDYAILKQLLLPGIAGGTIGACLLSSIPGETIKPFVTLYLLLMGVVILLRAFKKRVTTPENTKLGRLGLLGGFVDAVGGGGWGPVVTSSLVAKGNTPRFAIGSVNIAEFFVTTATSLTFILTLGLVHWHIILGLVAGGLLASPIAALACRHLKPQPMMIAVGLLIIGLSVKGLVQIPLNFAKPQPSIAATEASSWK